MDHVLPTRLPYSHCLPYVSTGGTDLLQRYRNGQTWASMDQLIPVSISTVSCPSRHAVFAVLLARIQQRKLLATYTFKNIYNND